VWFGLSGGLVILAAVALWQSIDAFRWRDWRRFWIASMLILPSCLGFGAAIWAGNHYPTLNFWGNLGRGPEWECENLGRGGAVVCARGSRPPLAEN
jgi:hypothetical protein